MVSSKYSVSFAGTTIEATVTDKAAGVDEWVQDVLNSYGHASSQRIIVGLDCEWKPPTLYLQVNKTATLQLCIDTQCLIIQLFYLDYIPQSLKNFLTNPNMAFVGVEVDDDVSKLQREYGLYCGTAADIQALAMARWPIRFYRKPGLKKLAYEVVGLSMEKPIHVCRSNWEARVLSLEQIQYACIDAYASSRIGRRLFNEN